MNAQRHLEVDALEAQLASLKAQRDECRSVLQSMVDDFDTGYIANPSVAADKKRERFRLRILSALALIAAAEKEGK